MSENRFNTLRQRYRRFTYAHFDLQIAPQKLHITYHFHIDGVHHFRPTLTFSFPGATDLSRFERADLEHLAFHLGLAEMLSYWKCTCAPTVCIEAGALAPEAVRWWQRLFFEGLSEFVYVNRIYAEPESWVKIEAPEGTYALKNRPLHGALLPIGGGKDSALSLDILETMGQKPLLFAINPIAATRRICTLCDPENARTLTLERTIDPHLIALNKQGYLNGHTPFSAVVAFASVAAAYLSGTQDVVLSNETSANEANTIFNGHEVNHQYSKSLHFERLFRDYNTRFFAPEVNYFSLLRPLHEITIARAFAKLERFLPLFNSCNRGGRADRWCGECPKCLFSFIILSPFLPPDRLKAIFGANLLDKADLKPLFNELTGLDEAHKPLECVGTYEEVKLALCETIRREDAHPLPALLADFQGRVDCAGVHVPEDFEDHNLPPEYEAALRRYLA